MEAVNLWSKVAGILSIIGAAPLLFMVLGFFSNAEILIETGSFSTILPSLLYSFLCGGLSLIGGIFILVLHKQKLGLLALIGGILGIIGAVGVWFNLYKIWIIDFGMCSGFQCVYIFLWEFGPPLLSMVGGILGLFPDDNYNDVKKISSE